MQLLDRRKMTKAQQAEYWKAYRYVRRHRRWMDYQGYRRRGLPIGSGVTEAACKTIVNMRLGRSGAKWKEQGAAVVLSLRTLVYTTERWKQFGSKVDCFDFPIAA